MSGALLIVDKLSKRIAFAFPVFMNDWFDNERSTFSESSFKEIFLLAIIKTRLAMIGITYIVRSFSDFKSRAFCRIFSNIAAAVATTIVIKVQIIQRARKPAGSSSLLW